MWNWISADNIKKLINSIIDDYTFLNTPAIGGKWANDRANEAREMITPSMNIRKLSFGIDYIKTKEGCIMYTRDFVENLITAVKNIVAFR